MLQKFGSSLLDEKHQTIFQNKVSVETIRYKTVITVLLNRQYFIYSKRYHIERKGQGCQWSSVLSAQTNNLEN